MINQLEMPVYIKEALPELSNDLNAHKKDNPFEALNTLFTFTTRNVMEHNYRVVKRCFDIADKLYSRGNGVVKNAVQNVFVYSFTKMFHSFPGEKKELMAMIHISLYTLYISQLYQGGC